MWLTPEQSQRIVSTITLGTQASPHSEHSSVTSPAPLQRGKQKMGTARFRSAWGAIVALVRVEVAESDYPRRSGDPLGFGPATF